MHSILRKIIFKIVKLNVEINGLAPASIKQILHYITYMYNVLFILRIHVDSRATCTIESGSILYLCKFLI